MAYCCKVYINYKFIIYLEKTQYYRQAKNLKINISNKHLGAYYCYIETGYHRISTYNWKCNSYGKSSGVTWGQYNSVQALKEMFYKMSTRPTTTY